MSPIADPTPRTPSSDRSRSTDAVRRDRTGCIDGHHRWNHQRGDWLGHIDRAAPTAASSVGAGSTIGSSRDSGEPSISKTSAWAAAVRLSAPDEAMSKAIARQEIARHRGREERIGRMVSSSGSLAAEARGHRKIVCSFRTATIIHGKVHIAHRCQSIDRLQIRNDFRSMWLQERRQHNLFAQRRNIFVDAKTRAVCCDLEEHAVRLAEIKTLEPVAVDFSAIRNAHLGEAIRQAS